MAPFYRGYEETVKLDIDDIRGIQEMYGPKKNKPEPNQSRIPILIVPKSAPAPTELERDNPICRTKQFDVIVTDQRGRTFVFMVRSPLNIVVADDDIFVRETNTGDSRTMNWIVAIPD